MHAFAWPQLIDQQPVTTSCVSSRIGLQPEAGASTCNANRKLAKESPCRFVIQIILAEAIRGRSGIVGGGLSVGGKSAWAGILIAAACLACAALWLWLRPPATGGGASSASEVRGKGSPSASSVTSSSVPARAVEQPSSASPSSETSIGAVPAGKVVPTSSAPSSVSAGAPAGGRAQSGVTPKTAGGAETAVAGHIAAPEIPLEERGTPLGRLKELQHEALNKKCDFSAVAALYAKRDELGAPESERLAQGLYELGYRGTQLRHQGLGLDQRDPQLCDQRQEVLSKKYLTEVRRHGSRDVRGGTIGISAGRERLRGFEPTTGNREE